MQDVILSGDSTMHDAVRRLQAPAFACVLSCLTSQAFGAATTQAASTSSGQAYPARPIRLIAPAPAAANLDFRARQLAQKLSAALGQQVIVDNRPGANSIIGTEIAARAVADGYTLFFGYHAIVMNPFLYQKLPYDAAKQFVPVAGYNTAWVGLYVNASVPVNSVKDLIALAQAKPDELTCASTGNGSGQHLSCHLFNKLTSAKVRIIHYKGLGQAVTDMLGGQITMVFDGLPVPLPLVKAGKLKALAISGAQRAASLPSLPTFREAGLPGYEMVFWTGVLAPSGTPQAIIDVINRETNTALKAPDILQSLVDTGSTPLGGSPADFTAFIKAESQKWGAIIKDSGARLD
jgi:tripartite-type tricarboxylate transporter receptor subunit TctC